MPTVTSKEYECRLNIALRVCKRNYEIAHDLTQEYYLNQWVKKLPTNNDAFFFGFVRRRFWSIMRKQKRTSTLSDFSTLNDRILKKWP